MDLGVKAMVDAGIKSPMAEHRIHMQNQPS